MVAGRPQLVPEGRYLFVPLKKRDGPAEDQKGSAKRLCNESAASGGSKDVVDTEGRHGARTVWYLSAALGYYA